MNIDIVLKNLLEKSKEIEFITTYNSELVFVFNKKVVCTIGKKLKNFYNSNNNFNIIFYKEAFQNFYNIDNVLRIVIDGDFEYYTTSEDEKTSNELISEVDLCEKIYNYLLLKLFNYETVFDNILPSDINNKISIYKENNKKLKSENLKPLLIAHKFILEPDKINNLNLDSKTDTIYFNHVSDYLWSIQAHYTGIYIFRLFLDPNINFTEYSQEIMRQEYIDPFYIDFKSSDYELDLGLKFKELYLSLKSRMMSADDVFDYILNN